MKKKSVFPKAILHLTEAVRNMARHVNNISLITLKTEKKCSNKCEYCQKFKWAIDRAKHYGEKLGIPWKEVMRSWDEDMNYWYMNYYQECNQPKIESNNVFVFESVEEMREKIGTEFICPCCKGVSTNPYECNSGVKIKGNKICDWKSYGLFQFGLAFIYCKKERKSTKCFMPKLLAH